MLDGAPPVSEPSISVEDAKALLHPLAFMPQMLGLVEAGPPQGALDEWAKAASRLSRHYPEMNIRLIDWGMFAQATATIYMPVVAEKKAKRNGTWDALRPKLVAAGCLPPEQLPAERKDKREDDEAA